MKKPSEKFRNILRVLGVLAAAMYILFLICEQVPLFITRSFADMSVYLLFLVFVLGFFFLWKNELISGIILIIWHGIQWFLVFWVWPDGALTLFFGLPIGILGILLLVYGIRKKNELQKT